MLVGVVLCVWGGGGGGGGGGVHSCVCVSLYVLHVLQTSKDCLSFKSAFLWLRLELSIGLD